MAFSLKKIFLPDPDTKLLAGFERSMETVGAVVNEATVASARARLTLAESAGKGASVEYPWYFHISGILYVASGEKNASTGRWVLRPVNEVEVVEDTRAIGETWNVAHSSWKSAIESTLPSRPYDRVVEVFGTLWGHTTGRVNLEARIGEDRVFAQFPPGGDGSQTVVNSAIVRAGVSPEIHLGIAGGLPSEGSGTVYLSLTDRWNRLLVKASPISMG